VRRRATIPVVPAENEPRPCRKCRGTGEEGGLIDALPRRQEDVLDDGERERACNQGPTDHPDTGRTQAAARPLRGERDRREKEDADGRIEREEPHRRLRLYRAAVDGRSTGYLDVRLVLVKDAANRLFEGST